jgi:transcriptional regulator with XRE-family HTH domain
MKISASMTDDAILDLLGGRIAAARVRQNLTQAAVAEQAGVAKRTLEAIEAGGSSRVVSLVRVLRVLGLVEGLDAVVPEIGPSPLELWQSGRPRRQRASSPRGGEPPPPPWQWGEGG